MGSKKRIKVKLPKDVEDVSSVRLIYHLSDAWIDVIYRKQGLFIWQGLTLGWTI
jgi:hypothetical protein